jgi:hypothetical protein
VFEPPAPVVALTPVVPLTPVAPLVAVPLVPEPPLLLTAIELVTLIVPEQSVFTV